MKDNRSKIIFASIACIILFLSFIPRFYDILKFLPDYSVDENEVVEYAVGYFGGDYDQRFYSYGPLLSYLLSIILRVMSWFSSGTLDDFAQRAFFDNTTLYYTARFLNGVISLTIGYLVFRIIERIWNQKTAFMTLPFLVFPFAELLTAFTTRVDTFLGVTYALSLWFMMAFYESKKWKHLLLIALFAGMGFAIKPLPSLLILPSLFLGFSFMHFYPKTEKKIMQSNVKQSKKRKKSVAAQTKTTEVEIEDNTNFIQKIFRSIPRVLADKKFYLFFIFSAIAAYIFFPHAFKNWSAPNGFKEQQLSRISLESGKEGILGYRLDQYLASFGLPLLIISVIGLIYSLITGFLRKNYMQIIVTLLPIIVLLAFAKNPARNYWYAPVASFMMVGIAAIFHGLSERLKSDKIQIGVMASLILALLFLPAKDLFSRSKKLNTHTNFDEMLTTLAAKSWVEQNIPQNSSIAFYGYYTFLPRLVGTNANTQAGMGDYFMYFKGGNRYYVEQFTKAHQKYVANPENKMYNLYSSLPYVDQNQQNQQLPLRYQNDEYEVYFKQLLQANKIQYVVSQYRLKPEWDELMAMEFKKDDFSFGNDVYVYKVE
jgi:hypothetical protein